MEVMISVLIISVIIFALLQMFANNTHLVSHIKSKEQSQYVGSFFIASDELEKKEQNLYDFLRAKYNISNDTVRENIKKTKVFVDENIYDSISMKRSDRSFQLFIYKKFVKTKGSSVNIMRLEASL